LTIALLLATVTSAASSDEGRSENEVKAAILYNLAEFVTWPEEALSAWNPRLVVCLFNKPDFQLNFEVLQGQPLKNRSLDIRKIHYEHELDNCHVVFLSIKSIKKTKPILAASVKKHILTVSDFPDFSRKGGMIELATVGSRIQISINLARSTEAKLQLSSNLLNLATVVIDTPSLPPTETVLEPQDED
jgi:hypothetical protein